MYYPMMWNTKEKKVLVIGGGKTGFRKVKKLIAYPVEITVMSEHFLEAFDSIENITCIETKVTIDKLDFLKAFDVVFAATDDKNLNRSICKTCKEQRILVNSVTSKEASFIVPASFTIGSVTVSVSTNATAPFLSKKIKNDLKKIYTEEYITLLGKVRDKLIEINQQQKLTKVMEMNEKELTAYYEEICRGH